jgi:NADPH:quinone reductase-like Zn-dependent oxidoreductase
MSRLCAFFYLWIHVTAKTMRAWQATQYDPDLSISVKNVAIPTPDHNEILIRVMGSSVNPIDWKVVTGDVKSIFPLEFPQTLGCDISGEVIAVGSGVTRLKVGDEVWADLGAGATEGAYAEFAVVSELNVGMKPSNIPHNSTSTIPLVGKTMVQAFEKAFKATKTARNKTVFITSGTGGTGFIGVQLAKAYGASTIITTASTSNVRFAKALGATQVFDYTKQNWWEIMEADSVDIVIDNYGKQGTPDRSLNILRSGGAFVSLAHQNTTNTKPGVSQFEIICNASRYSDLDSLKLLFEAEQLRPAVYHSFPLNELPLAFNESRIGTVVGKIAILPFIAQRA